jgi:hypothetical protein
MRVPPPDDEGIAGEQLRVRGVDVESGLLFDTAEPDVADRSDHCEPDLGSATAAGPVLFHRTRNLRPTASSPGQNRWAVRALTNATGGAMAVSRHSNSRPLTSGIRNALK